MPTSSAKTFVVSRRDLLRLVATVAVFALMWTVASRTLGMLHAVHAPVGMGPETATVLLAVVSGVVARHLGWRRISLCAGGVAVALGTAVLAQQVSARPGALLTLISSGDASGLIDSAGTALALAVALGMLLVQVTPGLRPRFRRGASLVLAGAVVSVTAEACLAPSAPIELDAAPPSMVFALVGLVGFGVVLRWGRTSRNVAFPDWGPWLVGGAISLLAVAVWAGLQAEESRWRRRALDEERGLVRAHAETVVAAVDASVSRAVALLDQGVPDALSRLLSELAVAEGALLVDRAGRPQQVERTHGMSAEQLVERFASRAAVQAAWAAREHGGLAVTPVAPDGKLSLCRLTGEGDTLFVVLRAEPFLAGFLPGDAVLRYRPALADGGPRRGPRAQAADVSLALGDRVVFLQPDVSPPSVQPMPTTATHVLFGGFLLALVLGCSTQRGERLRRTASRLGDARRTAVERASALGEANEALQRETDALRCAEETLRRESQERRRVLDSLSAFLIAVDGDGVVTEWNFVATEVFGLRGSEALGRRFDMLPLPWDAQVVGEAVAACLGAGQRQSIENLHLAADDERLVSLTVNPTQAGARRGFALVGSDVTERRMLEVQLRASQKLESVGTLAAGIAHEINTPMQFVGDNVRFVGDTLPPLCRLLRLAPELRDAALRSDDSGAELAARVDPLLAELDIEFVVEELPMALEETLEGIERVSTIVRAMKDFSHPGGEDRSPADVNEAVLTTLAVARNEYKYIAEVELELGELPPVECWIGDLKQVFLNLLVNGTHAIRDRLGPDASELGALTVSSRLDGDVVELRFSDSGGGIPEHVQGRIFEQFFTTKEVGRGTGMGLAICRSVVVEKHGGTLEFETEAGVGTTFVIRVPIHAEEAATAAPNHATTPVCR